MQCMVVLHVDELEYVSALQWPHFYVSLMYVCMYLQNRKMERGWIAIYVGYNVPHLFSLVCFSVRGDYIILYTVDHCCRSTTRSSTTTPAPSSAGSLSGP